MTTWLVTGGAGYIGSHVVRALAASGRRVVVLDDFSAGLSRRLAADVPVVTAPVQDVASVSAALDEYGVDGVVHLAAKKAAGESVELPELYYRENVGGLASLLTAMREVGVPNLVYSSSAAVYGTPAANPVPEDAVLHPESPYGETKVVGEWMARDAGVAWGLSWTALRYFNVAGSQSDDLGDSSVANLIPMVFRALDRGERPRIFGDDYPTPDGTCIRDYIHVSDLAAAHTAALNYLRAGGDSIVANCGYGHGFSVKEVLQSVERVAGHPFDIRQAPRRPGDPASVVSDPTRAKTVLKWTPKYDDLDTIVTHAMNWEQHLSKRNR